MAFAQQSATLTLRSGERFQLSSWIWGGRLHRPGRRAGTTDSDQRRRRHRFHRGSISTADWDKLNGGGQVLILKSGETITGQLVDIGGSSPLRMTFRTPSGERDFSSNDIARIVMSRPDNAAATSGTAASSGAATGPGIAVPSQQQWTPTGITVRRGDWVSFNASGEVHIGRRVTPPSASTASPACLPPVLPSPTARQAR